ncbi:Hydroxyethylthiazole kinase family-domain-containing protein [Aspergillus egyptiacus]|nr:Hydroxyethylthiazole kinase family-domain-containing protein [Aspergillus egyptiacus]
MKLDLSLYLVTDSTPAILKGQNLCSVVEEACKGGVTVVQYRDKKSDTGVQIETARQLHRITQKYGVPLIINDRVDVALAIGAEGVHLGQDDMLISEAKKLLPKDAIVGISASSVEEAQAAVAAGADYLGIGTLFATPTKTNTKSIIGTAGTQRILDAIADSGRDVGTVCIGGINQSNVQRVLYQSASPKKSLDGAAIVSAIMAADDPQAAAKELAQLIATPPPFVRTSQTPVVRETGALLESVPHIVQKLVQVHPLVHNMINFVVANFVANVTLAIGASPIMSPYGDEATDLCQFDGALLINMGTLTSQSPSEYLKAIKAYNQRGNPVVYDPVGAGATQIRRGVVKDLMAGGYFDLIKGNEGEIRQVAGSTGVKQRGVDSGPSALDNQAKARLARDLARRERNIVLLTGATDYLSDGERVIAVENGHELLGQVTGTGCAVGTVAGCFLATHPTDKFLAVLSALLMYEIAAENAAAKDHVRGPGSFAPTFIDELYAIRQAALKGDHSWYESRAKVKEISVE